MLDLFGPKAGLSGQMDYFDAHFHGDRDCLVKDDSFGLPLPGASTTLRLRHERERLDLWRNPVFGLLPFSSAFWTLQFLSDSSQLSLFISHTIRIRTDSLIKDIIETVGDTVREVAHLGKDQECMCRAGISAMEANVIIDLTNRGAPLPLHVVEVVFLQNRYRAILLLEFILDQLYDSFAKWSPLSKGFKNLKEALAPVLQTRLLASSL